MSTKTLTICKRRKIELEVKPRHEQHKNELVYTNVDIKQQSRYPDVNIYKKKS